MYRRMVAIIMGILIVTSGITSPAQELTDPYEILTGYFEATGGLERLLAEKMSYSEGSVSLGGMEGVVKSWTQVPGLSRLEVTLDPLNIIQGDNGEYPWVVDQNGKLQLITNLNDATLKRRKVRNLIQQYAYADRNSEIFDVSFQGVEQVDGRSCYVVRVANNINVDSYTCHINTTTFLLEKAVFIEDEESRDVLYGDYREIDGIVVPFRVTQVDHSTREPQEIIVTQYVSNPDIDPSTFEPPTESDRDWEFVNGDAAENIHFEFIEGHIFVPVNVRGKERLWVLDTGAGMTVLNRAFADELGLEVGGGMKGKGAGGTVDVAFTTLPAFSVEGIRFNEQTAAVIDMSELMRWVGVDAVGILGWDFLSRFVTRVDYANELLSFYDPEKFQYTGDGHVVDMHVKNSLFSATATLDGVHTKPWVLDLGASVTHLDGSYALREGYTERDGVLSLGHGAANEYRKKSIICDSLTFAGFTVYKPEVCFSWGGTDTAFTADDLGELGNSLFRNFVLYCDYLGERLIVETGAKFNQPWPVDNSGLQIVYNEANEIEVIYVSPGTPAEKAGFAKGDILRSVNGVGVEFFDGLLALRELLRSTPGTAYTLKVDRTGESKEMKLVLASLL
ncbi:MAG: aspartyl protease family protein [Candidatus Zixiibacteriota bacterium]